MTSNEEWTWQFTTQAAGQFGSLDGHVQDRIVSKLDEIVESEWRDPDEFLEPLTGGPFSKLRVGQYRLACVLAVESTFSRSIESNTEVVPTRLTTTEKEGFPSSQQSTEAYGENGFASQRQRFGRRATTVEYDVRPHGTRPEC